MKTKGTLCEVQGIGRISRMDGKGPRYQRAGLHGMAENDITSVLSSADTVLE